MSADIVGAVRDQNLFDIADTDLATAAAAFADTALFLRDTARPWFEAEGARVADEQTILHSAGVLAVALRAAEAARRHGSAEEARLLAGKAARDVARFLFEAGGTSTTDDPRDFGRHWRAALDTARRAPLRQAAFAAGRAALERVPAPPNSNILPVGLPHDQNDAYHRADIVAHSLRHGAAIRDRDRLTPKDELDLIARSGLLAVTVPRTYGGVGLGFAEALEISRRLSIGDSSVGQIMTIHYSMVEALIRTGTEAQLAHWLPLVVQGARFGNAAAERGVAHAKITATRLSAQADGTYRLSGRKFYSTGATGADFVTILALGDDGQNSTVVLPASSTGLSILDDWRGLGQRGTGSGTTILDDVALSADQILPRWLNAEQPSTGTAAANLAHVGIDLGIARAAFEDALQLLRSASDVPDEIIGRIGDFSARLHASETLFAAALDTLSSLGNAELTSETVQQFSLQVSVVKVHAGELAIDIAEGLLDIASEYDDAAQSGLDRHWRNARTHTLHDPSRWRYLRIGDHALNGRLPPRNRTN